MLRPASTLERSGGFLGVCPALARGNGPATPTEWTFVRQERGRRKQEQKNGLEKKNKEPKKRGSFFRLHFPFFLLVNRTPWQVACRRRRSLFTAGSHACHGNFVYVFVVPLWCCWAGLWIPIARIWPARFTSRMVSHLWTFLSFLDIFF